ncbi:MAG: ubiquinol-cytochrome c reductase iron-sulfur subunit [Chloroflexi bacterium]|nr:ubiquinol-cytochrome c reductase iron-sulfur subunit [Chloroflexota bacterium]
MVRDSRSPGDGSGEKNKALTRRQFLSRAWWAASGLLVVEASAGLVASLWPKLKAGSFGTKVRVASVEEVRAMPVGTITYFAEQRFYLSRVESGFLALYRKCVHLGCVIPWLADESSEDDLADKGRFNCPCHGGIYDRYGLVHAGPPPRPLDLFPISVENGEVIVDTGTVIQRSAFDESQVTKI